METSHIIKTMSNKVLIIGGGLGGLVCGAILAKEGYSVRILEKHTVAGGGLHTFQRNGAEWESGIHVISGFQRNGVLRQLFEYLGIMDKLRIKPANRCGFDHLHIASDGKTYKMASGRENFVETLGDYFPEEKENIRRYIEKVYEICSGIALFNLNAPTADIYTNEAMTISVNELIASYTDNPKLQAVLAWNNGLYGGVKDQTPAYIGAFITQFYIEGASRFIDGSQQLANALAEVIVQNGGEILTGNAVSFIDVQELPHPGPPQKGGRQVKKVVTAKGQEFTADWYISAIHTSSMFKLMDVTKIQKSYYQRIDNIPNSCSSFTTYVTLKPQSFPYLNYTGFYITDYDDLWKCAEYETSNWPRGFMYITPPLTDNDAFAQKIIVTAMMNFNDVRQWENTVAGRRGEEYLAFKKHCENRLLDMMEKIFPDFRTKIESVFSASPLTIRDFLGSKEGANFGTIRDCTNMAASIVAVRTKVNNLLLTGQCVNLHGILGVPITAVITCGELLGLEELLHKIKNTTV